MNTLEQHSIASGLFKYLLEQTESPLDAVAILGFVLLMIYDAAAKGMPIEEFANDFRISMVQSYRTQGVPGTETRQ